MYILFRETLIDSHFYKDLIDILEQHLLPTKPQEMICYGIGSMQYSKNAQYQFILALLIRDMLKEHVNKVSIYDPVMTELDKELSKAHNIEAIDTNEDGKRRVFKPTLFYMPHCGRGLYSNTLSVNWDKQSLSNVIMIANRFDMYVGSQLERDLRRECPYLIPAAELVEYASFPKEFDDNKVFNDLSVIAFPKNKVECVKDTFWETVPKDVEEEE
ncbi:SRR1-domain-containing protein [Phascolomyces articulosus]|uniref:SRR1-domain-containing protein n=1 Tax=Phascolomyces articulosus TaxID=60185 RepID=A0AAD5P8S3_9FUNG|nr:SRR1-domain-containing protein [Phascolomyces articulosus]